MTGPSLAYTTQANAPSDNAMRTGTVYKINFASGTVNVDVGGQILTLNRLAGVAVPAIGSTVALLREGSTWLVLGEIANGAPFDGWIEVPQAVITTSGGVWVSITAGTTPTINNGILRMRYRQADSAGKRYEIEMYLKGGSSTAWGTGVYGWTLPFAASADSALFAVGSAHVLNALTAEYTGTSKLFSTTVARMFWAGAGGGASVANNSPFVFGQDDEMRFSIFVDRA